MNTSGGRSPYKGMPPKGKLDEKNSERTTYASGSVRAVPV